MRIQPVKTGIFNKGQDLAQFVIENLPEKLTDGAVLAITSKIVSLAENRTAVATDKIQLIKNEADAYLGEIGYGTHLTVKCGLLIASAGIDDSNSPTGESILFPVAPFESARKIHEQMCAHFEIKNLGIILTDSRTSPLRHGVVGVALAYHGFSGLKNQMGELDLFGRELRITRVNIADSLASAATFVMGEGAESCPLAVISGANLTFTSADQSKELGLSIEDDMYFPMYQHMYEDYKNEK